MRRIPAPPVPFPAHEIHRSFHCATATVLPDGRMLIVGHHHYDDPNCEKGKDDYPGGPYAAIYEGDGDANCVLGTSEVDRVCRLHDLPDTGLWGVGCYPRRYPNVVVMPDGDAWVFGGTYWTGGPVLDHATWMRFDSSAVGAQNPWTVKDPAYLDALPPNNAKMSELPHVYVLPSGLFWAMALPSPSRSYLFNWMADPLTCPEGVCPDLDADPQVHLMVQTTIRPAGTSVLLPLSYDAQPGDERVLAIGGFRDSTVMATNSVERWRPGKGKGMGWMEVAPMAHARKHPKAVLLPDKTVFVVGGHGDGNHVSGAVEGVLPAEIYDPQADAWKTVAGLPLEYDLDYYLGGFLLPDGRVFVSGQKIDDPSERYMIYYPPYFFSGHLRPVIGGVSSSEITYGSTIGVTVPPGVDYDKVILIRPGVCSHDMDTNQRLIELEITGLNLIDRDGSITFRAHTPANSTVAVPGYYMLFLLSSQGVPSIAKWVHLD